MKKTIHRISNALILTFGLAFSVSLFAAPACDLSVETTKNQLKDFIGISAENGDQGTSARQASDFAMNRCLQSGASQCYVDPTATCSHYYVSPGGSVSIVDGWICRTKAHGYLTVNLSETEIKQKMCGKVLNCQAIYVGSGTATDADYARLEKLAQAYGCQWRN